MDLIISILGLASSIAALAAAIISLLTATSGSREKTADTDTPAAKKK